MAQVSVPVPEDAINVGALIIVAVLALFAGYGVGYRHSEPAPPARKPWCDCRTGCRYCHPHEGDTGSTTSTGDVAPATATK